MADTTSHQTSILPSSRFGHLQACVEALSCKVRKRSQDVVKKRVTPAEPDNKIESVPVPLLVPSGTDETIQFSRQRIGVATRLPSAELTTSELLNPKDTKGVFRRKSRPINATQPQTLQTQTLRIQQEVPTLQKESQRQDPSNMDMNSSKLNLSRAAALAKQIKANGGKHPNEITCSGGDRLPTARRDQTEASDTRRDYAFGGAASASRDVLVDTEAVKAEVAAQVAAIHRAARSTLATNLEKSGRVGNRIAAEEMASHIEHMVQKIVDLYVPLFERELRVTLENDILEKLSILDNQE
jgi:hypothetical protein